jgi:hypothetical protein
MGRTLSRHSGIGLIYVLEDLLTGKCQEGPARRIRFFRNSEFEGTQSVPDHLSYETGELHTIEKFVGIREWHGSIEVKARWRGHGSWEDNWEGTNEMVQDVPLMLEAYLAWVCENGTFAEKSLVDRSQRYLLEVPVIFYDNQWGIDVLSPAYCQIISDTLLLSCNPLMSDTLLLSYNQLIRDTLLLS